MNGSSKKKVKPVSQLQNSFRTKESSRSKVNNGNKVISKTLVVRPAEKTNKTTANVAFKQDKNLKVSKCVDIEERARVLDKDNPNKVDEREPTKPHKRNCFFTSFILNLILLLLVYPAFETVFCNDICEYNSPNIICPAVNESDPSENYKCLNHAEDCECIDSLLRGDNRCDPFNNNCGCGWDGGDCCTHDFDKTFCTENEDLCQCLDPWAPKLCSLGTCNEATVGNGQCDGHNNNCNCNWDGGDCCNPTYNCSKNCKILGNNVYNITVDSFSTCDYIGTQHLGGSSYCQELESNFGCDCSGCYCDINNNLGIASCTGITCECRDSSSPAFFAHNDAEQYTTYIPQDFSPVTRPSNATVTWELADVCDHLDFEAYEWDPTCTCPCRVSVKWYVNVGWIIAFGVAYFLYIIEGVFLVPVLSEANCAKTLSGKKLQQHFSSETLRFVRRVHGRHPSSAIEAFRKEAPLFLMRIDTYKNKQYFKAGRKPIRSAAARMKMTCWRDETSPIIMFSDKRHAKIWLRKTLCFDGYSTSTFFDKRRTAFLSKHRSNDGTFQSYTEELRIKNFKNYGIWSMPRNISLSTLFYLIFTFAGLSWFYRLYVECATTPIKIEIVKMISMNNRLATDNTGMWIEPPDELRLLGPSNQRN